VIADLSGLRAWQTGDRLVVGLDTGLRILSATSVFSEGVTFGTYTIQLVGGPLVDGPGRGHEASFQQVERTSLPGEITVSMARTALVTQALAARDGMVATFTGEMKPLTADEPVTLDLRRSAFDANRAAFGAAAGAGFARLFVYRLPPGLEDATPYITETFSMEASPGAGDLRLDVRATNAFPTEWARAAEVSLSFPVPIVVPGGMKPAIINASSRRVDLADNLLDGPVMPVLGPPGAVTIAGRAASEPLTDVGLTPTVSFSAPSLGTPTLYVVFVRLLSATVENVTWSTVATIYTEETSFRMPPELLNRGQSYSLSVMALAAKGAAIGSPFRRGFPYASADHVTARISP
jgi:hypothetical protein